MTTQAQNNPPAPPPTDGPVHADALAVISWFCGGCKAPLGSPDEFEIKKAGDRFEVPAESGTCDECGRKYAHGKIAVVEPL